MKRFFALLLGVACLLSCAAFASARTGKTTIGGKEAQTVTIDMRAGVSADVLFGQDSVSKDQSAADLIQTAGAKGKLLAVVNGGFFNAYYANGRTLEGYGAAARCYANVVKNGEVVNGGGGDQTAIYLGFTRDGKALIDEVGVTLYVNYNGKKVPTWGVNSYYPETNSILLFTPEAGYDLPVPANAKVAKIVGGKVTEIMTSGTMVCAADTYYFVCGKELHYRIPAVGTQVSFSTEFSKSEWNDVTTAVSCGPWLLHNGQNAFAENSKYDYLSEQNVSETSVAARTFAAVLANGELMLGVCTASPKQITEYLLSVGAKDAMLLDGGASSMLYADGKTLRAAGRKLNNVVCIYESAANGPGSDTLTAHESTLSVDLDGRQVVLPAYKLVSEAGDTNYVRLRDLAQLLSGTPAQFDVTWDGAAGAVNITGKHAYDHPNGTEGNVPFSGSQSCRAFTGFTLVNGTAADLDAFTITHNGDGHTYYQLRDLGRALGFNVGWSAARGLFIETGKPYTDAD